MIVLLPFLNRINRINCFIYVLFDIVGASGFHDSSCFTFKEKESYLAKVGLLCRDEELVLPQSSQP